MKLEIEGHVTTWEAIKYILKFNIIIVVNMWRGIDRIVHRFPWWCVIGTIVVSFLLSFVQICKARAERDSYSKKNVQLTEKIASDEAVFNKN